MKFCSSDNQNTVAPFNVPAAPLNVSWFDKYQYGKIHESQCIFYVENSNSQWSDNVMLPLLAPQWHSGQNVGLLIQ